MPESPTENCASCGVVPRPYDSIVYGSSDGPSRLLCGRCFNLEVAHRSGLIDFEHIDFEPVTMSDVSGCAHVFEMRTRLFGDGILIDAIESSDDDRSEGYSFRIIGDEKGDLFELFGKLVGKMRRALAQSHLEADAYGLQIREPGIVRGRIECDLSGGTELPMVVIDGRNVSWETFGHMITTYQGFQFKLEIRDLSDEI